MATVAAAGTQLNFTGRFPDFDRAIEHNYATFSQLAVADWGADWSAATAGHDQLAYRFYYPPLLRVFERSHGTIEDKYSSDAIECSVARTAPPKLKSTWLSHPLERSRNNQTDDVPEPIRAKQPDFHFVYNLAKVPIGGELLTRIEMLATDATRLLRGHKLADCLDQLYSKATDVLAMADAVVSASKTKATAEMGDQQQSPQHRSADSTVATHEQGSVSPNATEKPNREHQDFAARVAIIRRDLDVIELKYLITDARLKYFFGAFLSALAIALAVAIGGTLAPKIPFLAGLDRSFAIVVVFGAVGSLLSVVQRMTGNSLDVRYDLGATYTRLLGGFRPMIGAFAGVLLWMLVQAHIVANATGSDYFLGAIALGLGVSERSIGDVVTQSGILSRITPGPKTTDKTGD